MAEEKKEIRPTTKLNTDELTHLSSFLSLPPCRAGRYTNEQKNRLLSGLARYAAAGNVSQVTRLVTIRPELGTHVLFALAGLGAQDQMEPLLKQRPTDLLVYRPLRDISGAQFEHISLFQHALWTKDVRYIANMMLDCLPQNEQGEMIRLEMVRQYEELRDQGVVYQLNGMMQREHHFSLRPLIKALRTYVAEYNNWTSEQRQLHWCTVVGLAQTVLPAHIRHHYCDLDESFWDKPNFKKPKLNRSLEIYNWVVNKFQLWSDVLVGLGMDCGIATGPRGCGGRTAAVQKDSRRSAALSLAALKALDEMRTSIDMPALIGRLYTPIQNLEENQTVHQDMKI